MARRVIALLGCPIITEDGSASEAITPGMLVQGTTSIAKHASSGGNAARNFALEQDYLGKDIDEAYASGDQVRVGAFHQGCRVYALLPSGANITGGNFLESNGDGTLKAYGSGVVVARALESVNNSAGPSTARIRVEVV